METLIKAQAGVERIIVTFIRNDGMTVRSHYKDMAEAQKRLAELNKNGKIYNETYTIKS